MGYITHKFIKNVKSTQITLKYLFAEALSMDNVFNSQPSQSIVLHPFSYCSYL